MTYNQQADDLRRCCDALEAENMRLREALQREADWHEGEAKANRNMSKVSTGVFHGLKAEWHKERAQQIRAALSGEPNE